MFLYKDGMKINLSYKSTGRDTAYYVWSFLLMLCCWAFLGIFIVHQFHLYRIKPHMFLPLMIAYPVYLISACVTNSCRYLLNLVELP